jgi:hypothetical protein
MIMDRSYCRAGAVGPKEEGRTSLPVRCAARVEAAARADLTSTASLHSPRPCEARMGLASDAAVMLWTSAVFENRG